MKSETKIYLIFTLILFANLVFRYVVGENLDSIEVEEDQTQYIYVCADEADTNYYNRDLDLVLTKFGKKSCTTIEMP